LAQENRIVYLDGIRGIAALMVFFYHYLLAFYPALFVFKPEFVHSPSNFEISIGKTPINILYSGGFAVCIFFVLSGYVLSHKYFISRSYEYLASSAIKRYFRLGIPIFASVMISFSILSFNGYTNYQLGSQYTKSTFWFTEQWNIQPNFWEALKEGTYSALFEGKTMNYNSLLWTMNVEFVGSLLVFALLALAGNLRMRFIVYLILILLFQGGFLSAFILGVALCDYSTSKNRRILNTPVLIICSLVVLYFGSYQYLGGEGLWKPLDFLSNTGKAIPFIIGAGLLLFIVTHSPKMQHFLSHKWFGFLGKISFSLYLLHLIILGSLSCFLFRFFYDEFTLTYFSSFVLTLLIVLPVTLYLSYLMYKFVDSVAIKVSAAVYNKLFKP
jgi:peptidoglycan/LPS O-acetylase OafA/YrhL